MMNNKEITCDFGKKWLTPHICKYDWEGQFCYKCNNKENLEELTRSSWWVHYYKCNNCNTIYFYNTGDKMGGQCDTISYATSKDVEQSLQGEYKKEMELKSNKVYKAQADPIIDKLQSGFKIDSKGTIIGEEIPEEVWVLEVNNSKGIVYLFGNLENFVDEEDFANKAREYALGLVNKNR